jgi:hypothetical protein
MLLKYANVMFGNGSQTRQFRFLPDLNAGDFTFSTAVDFEWIALLLQVPLVLVSNLVLDTGSPGYGFSWFRYETDVCLTEV